MTSYVLEERYKWLTLVFLSAHIPSRDALTLLALLFGSSNSAFVRSLSVVATGEQVDGKQPNQLTVFRRAR